MKTQPIEPSDMPLFELFTRLRQAGIPLGIEEYQELLRALQAGFGVLDRISLARLCKILWIKSFEEENLFDYHFEQVIPSPTLSESPTSLEKASITQGNAQSVDKLSETMTDSISKSASILPVSNNSEVVVEINDEVQVAQAVLQSMNASHFIQTDEYFPISRRQMKQSWRYLRNPSREGPPIEVDIEATVNRIGQQGIMLEPVLIPRRTNRIELLLLLDQGGSMTPFHLLSERLAETALRGGRLGKTGIYYFHNNPVEYLYREPAHLNAISIQKILDLLQYHRTVVLIFSDAGAARGGLNLERVKTIRNFLNQLRQYVRYIAWLNPMPRSRWSGTTAGKILSFVPMFDLSRRGLDDAISTLRGRLVSYPQREDEA